MSAVVTNDEMYKVYPLASGRHTKIKCSGYKTDHVRTDEGIT